MALKDQPYLPLYIKDFEGATKLRECNAEATGVYIRIMCLMHKSNPYGKILLEQKYQQEYQQMGEQKISTCSDFVGAFAIKLKRHLPYSLLEIARGVCELLDNKVLYIEGDYIAQERMVKDGIISEKRAIAGKKSASGKGGKNNFVGTKASTKASTKKEQNTANAIAIVNEDKSIGNEGVQGEKKNKEPEVLQNGNPHIAKWNVDRPVGECLKFFIEDAEFESDRKYCLELFARQYIELPGEELLERIEAWGVKFNEITSGDYPIRRMRGDNSWTQHFKNYFKNKDLKENPLIIKLIKQQPEKTNTHKTAAQILEERKVRG